MIRSMTGFGTAAADENGARYIAEVRAVNNRFFKALVRLPEELQGLEPELESALSKQLSRGSVTVTVRFSETSGDAPARINREVLNSYLEQLEGTNVQYDLAGLLTLPGVVITDTGEERQERARSILVRLVEQACGSVQSMREREGQMLQEDLTRHCRAIEKHLEVIATRAPSVVDEYQERLKQRISTMLAETGAALRDEDLLREVAIYADRSDISEEVARLEGHLAQFCEIIDADWNEPSGRTLDFLSQEMLREANTIGSKCLDVEVSRRIVEIKGSIDRLKEQAQNVE
jgi:uncharacterized protein (TIGR00255 family)